MGKIDLKIIGVEGNFAKDKTTDEETINFYGNFFGRAREIKHDPGIVTRYIRYEEGDNVFIGLEIPEPDFHRSIGIPAGMTCWSLSSDSRNPRQACNRCYDRDTIFFRSCEKGSPDLKRTGAGHKQWRVIAFRDYLRSHPEAAREYASIALS
ncbi:MAG: hypothetical protein ABSG94_02640 [Brevinematales bacterium]|jgi:hypothetical protein